MSQSSSQSSIPDLSLSQDTINQLLQAVGMSGNVLTNCFSAEYSGDDDNDKIFDEKCEGSSRLSIRRGVFHQCITPYGSDSQRFSSSQTAPSLVTSTNNDHSSPSPLLTNIHGVPSPLCLPSSSGVCDMESPLISSSSNPVLTPPLPQLSSPFLSLEEGTAPTNTMSTIPLNTCLEGEYGFRIIPQVKERRAVKNSTYIFSSRVQRAFIKQGITMPFYFTLTHPPPADCVIRAMGIHTAPEDIGDTLACCPKHFNINQKQGLIFPVHFIRPCASDSLSIFHTGKRHSITTPFSTLQKHSEDQYSALYVFPCYTSDFSRTGQLVQIIFTLEHGNDVLGRTTLDIRVCASPGRDRDVDEKKTQKEDPELCNGRKRGATSLVSKCVLPPKKLCHPSNEKVKYTIETYPEIIPFVDVCVRMMEKVHHVPTTVATGNSQGEESQSQFDTLDGWLEHLGLKKYMKLLQQNGISEPFQVLSITDEELKKWGMKTASHRKKFLDNKDLISPVLEDSPVLFSQSSQPMPSSQTSHINLVKSQSFEVVEITMEQCLSASSSNHHHLNASTS